MRAAVLLLLLAAAVPVSADPPKPRGVRVLYVEGAPRWEYRWHRALLERGGEKKEFLPRVFLPDADPQLAETDPAVMTKFPTGAQLLDTDLVILGDIDPNDPGLGEKNLKQLAAFVTEHGGGLLVVAGSHHSPHAFKGTPLEALLPIELGEKPDPKEADDPAGYRVRPTTAGMKHPAFQLGKDADETHAAWDRFPVMYRWSSGYTARPGAEVLAVHQTEGPASSPHPLILVGKAGKGRVAFVGFDESWRWRRNEGEKLYQAFWVSFWRSLAAAG